MEEGEHKLCLVVVQGELGEETLLQVQMQLLELVEDREALEAEEEKGVEEETVMMHTLALLEVQEVQVLSAELVVMEAAVAAEVKEGHLLPTLHQQD